MKNDKPARILALSFLFLAITSVGSASAQSKDRDNPTPLTSNEISGLIDRDNRGDNYHYTFVAGPGEVTITLSVEAGRESYYNYVEFDLFDEDAKRITNGFVQASSGKTEQTVKHINFTRRQSVLLRISITDNHYRDGKYRLRLGGAVNIGRGGFDPVPRPQRDNTDNPECLLKKGILRVKMKDGSVRRIDLSEAEEITIEPQVSNIDKRQSAEEFFTIAGDLQKQGKYREAIENYTMAIELYPGHADAFYRRGEVKFILQDYRGAIEDYSRCIQLVPDESHFVYSKRGDARLNLQDYQGALADYNKFFKPQGFNPVPGEKPTKPTLLSRLGINWSSLFPNAYNNRGFAKNKIGDKAGACEDFRISCEMRNPTACENSKKNCN